MTYCRQVQAPNTTQNMFLDPLYCTEDSLEDVRDEDPLSDEQQDESFCGNIIKISNNINKFPIFLEQDLSWEEEELATLFSKEEKNHLHEDILKNPYLAKARCEAVEWMLKVNAHYCFSALTAVLAVNYLDRFLYSFQFQADKPWMIQLAAVACLSLAAKVEETQVPLLLDLQVFTVEESRFVFEAKTIQRMEILVLSTLKWKMNPVTPLSFLDYVTRRLGLKDHLCCEFLRRCELILLSIISDSRFMCYLPSVIAAAIMLQVVNGIEASLGIQYRNQLLGILRIDKDKVEDCCKLILELEHGGFIIIGCQFSKKRKYDDSVPGSPNGVMDMSFSSDSSNDSWSVSSSPEHVAKRNKTHEDQLTQKLKHASSADVHLSIQR